MNYQPLILLPLIFIGMVAYSQKNDNFRPDFEKRRLMTVAKEEAEIISAVLKLNKKQSMEVEAIEIKFYSKYIVLARDSVFGIERLQNLKELNTAKEEALKKALAPRQWSDYVNFMKQRTEVIKYEIEQRRQRQRDSITTN